MSSRGRPAEEVLVEDCRPELARAGLLAVWVVVTGLEFSCWWTQITRWWWAIVIIVHSIWGWLDAILRFPKLHDLESLFALKHICLILIKMPLLAFAMKNLQKHVLQFIGLLFMNMVLPVIYLIMLPLDDDPIHQRMYSHGVVNEDIAIRICRFFANPASNWFRCKRKAEATLLGLVSRSPRAAEMARGLSPTNKRLSRERLKI
mmetsp:Transcript_75162/g.148740  ORF Transcript_75162/g.148740 Transcript_75162/m.148740 type:complete len:204 (-) Transcript_75162:71-682(-)